MIRLAHSRTPRPSCSSPSFARAGESACSATRPTAGLELDPSRTLPQAADLSSTTICLNVLSKAYGLPGLRIGWLATRDRTLLERLERRKQNTSICHPHPANCSPPSRSEPQAPPGTQSRAHKGEPRRLRGVLQCLERTLHLGAFTRLMRLLPTASDRGPTSSFGGGGSDRPGCCFSPPISTSLTSERSQRTDLRSASTVRCRDLHSMP